MSHVESLIRIVHLSDLHFGSRFAEGMLRLVPGVHLHHPAVASALSRSLRRELSAPTRSTTPLQHTVVTGDLTTYGSEQSLDVAVGYVRGTLKEVRSRRGSPGLNQSDASLNWGNHDVWGGALLGLTSLVPLNPLEDFPPLQHHSETAAPLAAVRLTSPYFPYQVRLDLGACVVYLYGLDSTRNDLVDRDNAARSARGLTLIDDDGGIVYHTFWADGYCDLEQLSKLAAMVREEEARDDSRCVYRFALIHHPLAYPDTSPTFPHLRKPEHKILRNLGEVQSWLYRLNFSAVLCGHQHEGFVKEIFPDSPGCSRVDPLYVLSVGTATQYQSLWGDDENEYRIYEIDGDDKTRLLRVKAYRCNISERSRFMLSQVTEYPLYQPG